MELALADLVEKVKRRGGWIYFIETYQLANLHAYFFPSKFYTKGEMSFDNEKNMLCMWADLLRHFRKNHKKLDKRGDCN